MKNILLATTVLVGTAGFAAAEVTLSGDARMGLLRAFDDAATAANENDNTAFESRARAAIGLSGESDSGLSFGGSFGVQDAVGAAAGTAGSVFVSGAFGKLSMGDVDGAAKAAVGHAAGVGLTGLGDRNEVTYIAGGAKESALYEYSTGAFTGYVSAGQLGGASEPMAIGAKYSADTYVIGLGYEDNDAGSTHVIGSASVTMSGVTLKAVYGSASGVVEGNQWAVSASYTADALTVTAFAADDTEVGGAEAQGLGASYALGGGASVVGGVVRDNSADATAYDIGLSFSF